MGRERKRKKKEGRKKEGLRKRRRWATPTGSSGPEEVEREQGREREEKKVETCCRINEQEGE